MEDFRHIGRLVEVVADRQQEFERVRRNAQALPRPLFDLRRILFSLTVITGVAVGRVTWWGQ